MNCSICIKKYTGKHRIKITCPECNHDVCSQCFVKYIMSVLLKPCCMYCKTPVHICLYKKHISAKRYKDIIHKTFSKTLFIEEANISKENNNKEVIFSGILDVIRCTKCDTTHDSDRASEATLVVKTDVNEKTHKSILKCILCETVFCISCFIPIHSDKDSHVCDSKMKQCPKCFMLIEKTDLGCDQMFCVLCNTVFSWKTGLIVDAKNGHNPHYYEWKRKKGELSRHELDDPREGRFYIKCETVFKDQKIKLVQIQNIFNFPIIPEVDKTEFLLKFHRMFLNTITEISNYLDKDSDIRHNLRIHYASDTFSKTSWKRYLKKHFYLIKQYEAIKYNILKTLNVLYTLTLNDAYTDQVSTDTEIEKLCLQAVQQTDFILTD